MTSKKTKEYAFEIVKKRKLSKLIALHKKGLNLSFDNGALLYFAYRNKCRRCTSALRDIFSADIVYEVESKLILEVIKNKDNELVNFIRKRLDLDLKPYYRIIVQALLTGNRDTMHFYFMRESYFSRSFSDGCSVPVLEFIIKDGHEDLAKKYMTCYLHKDAYNFKDLSFIELLIKINHVKLLEWYFAAIYDFIKNHFSDIVKFPADARFSAKIEDILNPTKNCISLDFTFAAIYEKPTNINRFSLAKVIIKSIKNYRIKGKPIFNIRKSPSKMVRAIESNTSLSGFEVEKRVSKHVKYLSRTMTPLKLLSLAPEHLRGEYLKHIC